MNTGIPDLCCIGHITKDKIITKHDIKFSPGGTAFYFSNAIKVFKDIEYFLSTIIGKAEEKEIDILKRSGLKVISKICEYSVYFENIYGENLDERKQCVLSKAEPFSYETINSLEASIIHFGPLLNDDFSIDAIKSVSKKHLVSLDVQGFLRTVDKDHNVIAIDWYDKENVLKNIQFLKANEYELMTLTKTKNIIRGIKIISNWGVKEIIITLGHLGSLIFNEGKFYRIPAYKPKHTIDVTGCGDTYMAGYLYSRINNKNIEEAGNFAAAMATLKIEYIGPFSNSYSDIFNCINNFEKTFPEIL